MKTATISEAKNQLSKLLERVRMGETILIMDRDQPVAQLTPITASPVDDAADEARLARLERAGLVRRGKGGPIKEILAMPLARPKRGGDILKALLDERRSGR